METINTESTCLTFEQLRAYVGNKITVNERDQLYMHISHCEMCSCAVNGFAMMPIVFDEIVAIHRKIDKKTKVAFAKPLTIAHILILFLSILSIGGSISLLSYFEKVKPVKSPVVIHTSPKKSVSIPAITTNQNIATHPAELNMNGLQSFTSEKKGVASQVSFDKIEILPSKTIKSASASSPKETERTVFTSHMSGDVIYIYDLKVVEYSKLYFNNVSLFTEFDHSTPASIENRGSHVFDDNEVVKTVPADKLLKDGLKYFNKGIFGKAAVNFQQLINLNKYDVNALFYNAISNIHLGNNNLAICNLKTVLKNKNEEFYQEAKWYLSQAEINSGNIAEAKILLIEIAESNGFYANRAKEKLSTL